MSQNNNKKPAPIIYGLAIIAAIIGGVLFSPVKVEQEPATEQRTEIVTSVISETTASENYVSEDSVPEFVSEITTKAEIQSTVETTTVETTTVETTLEIKQEATDYYFRNQSVLDSHYEKHGIEMGFSSAEEYESAASDVINSPNALYKTEKEDGDGVYYIEDTNEFAVLSTDGYIRTYFYPSAGKDYFDRQ